jgi:uncharacterized protein (DUF1786 family)
MKILTVDIGTGTQDIFLYDSRLDIENGYKLIVPSPTLMVKRRMRQAAQVGRAVALTGRMMGGGPSTWGADAHLRAGLAVYATPDAARSFNDDLEAVRAMGVTLLSEDEVLRLPQAVERIEMRDFDFAAIARAFAHFDVGLSDLTALAVGVFDHGNAPPDVSDRKFRFDYLDGRIRAAAWRTDSRHPAAALSTFAYLSAEIPAIMTRLQAVAVSAANVDAPLVVMDTAPAAVLGATFDPHIRRRQQVIAANVGNMHTLAFRLGEQGVEGVFEHHTGFLDCARLDELLSALADGSLRHEQVFGAHGHGALLYSDRPLRFPQDDFGVAVTGPRRSLLAGSALRPYFAAPFGDMMVAGCFGLLAATADLLPEMHDAIMDSLLNPGENARAPWDE